MDRSADSEGFTQSEALTNEVLTTEALTKAMFKVSGNCDMCKECFETAAKSVTGVVTAEWKINEKILHVQFDVSKTNSDANHKIVAKSGHDTGKFKAPDEVYKQLPECCLYRK